MAKQAQEQGAEQSGPATSGNPGDRHIAPPAGPLGICLKVILHEDEAGGYWAEVPALPGCVSEGETLEEVQANVREAVAGWLEAGNDTVPKETHPGDQVLEMPL